MSNAVSAGANAVAAPFLGYANYGKKAADVLVPVPKAPDAQPVPDAPVASGPAGQAVPTLPQKEGQRATAAGVENSGNQADKLGAPKRGAGLMNASRLLLGG